MFNRLYDLVKDKLIPKFQRIKNAQKTKSRKFNEIKEDIEFNPYGVYEDEFRDQTNLWIEDSIAEIKYRKKSMSGNKEDKVVTLLYRFLSLKYKCHYPMTKTQPHQVDKDIMHYLELLICKSMTKFIDQFSTEQDPHRKCIIKNKIPLKKITK